MKIEVLGTGCAKCKTLYEAVQKAVKERGIEAEIIKAEDTPSIMKYGVMSAAAGLISDATGYEYTTISAGNAASSAGSCF